MTQIAATYNIVCWHSKELDEWSMGIFKLKDNEVIASHAAIETSSRV